MLIPFLVFLGSVVVCAVTAAPVFVRLGRQLSRTAGEVRHLETSLDQRLLSRAESLLGQVTASIHDLESASASYQNLGRLAEESISPLGDIAVDVEAALQPFARSAGDLGWSRPRVRAVGFGLAAAWKSWRTRTGRREQTGA